VDRKNRETMVQAIEKASFDLVYDQICFNPREAEITVEAFGDPSKTLYLYFEHGCLWPQ
jgi:hypothetical protein